MKKYFFSILLLFIIDRFSKIYILKNSSSSLGGFFSLQINKDMAFSLPMTYLVLYPIIILILIILIWFWKKDMVKKSILIWPWALIIIGAISNLLDRIKYGGVIDFINLPYFTVFNLSDVYISMGVVWILWYEWFFRKNKNLDKNLTRS
jgi:signal peptidase II